MRAFELESLVGWSARASLLLLAAGILNLALKRHSAALRHAVWAIAIAGALAIPFLNLALPGWKILPVPSSESVAIAPPVVVEPAIVERVEMSEVPFIPVGELSPAAEVDAPAVVGAESSKPFPWAMIVVGLWGIGAGFLLLRLLVGQLSLVVLRRRASHCEEMSGDVEVKVIDQAIPPMVCGLFKPTILLPVAALDWSVERLNAVLQHECAHIRRRDLLTGWSARCLCALQWFNPLAWIGAARMRAESEHACDDAVILAGMPGTEYAGHLLEVATLAGVKPDTLPVTAMASGPEVEGRLRYAIDQRRSRRSLGLVGWLVVAALLAPLVLAFALADEKSVSKTEEGDENNSVTEVLESPNTVRKKTAVKAGAAGSDEDLRGRAKDEFYIKADTLDNNGSIISAKGNVVLRTSQILITADSLEYDKVESVSILTNTRIRTLEKGKVEIQCEAPKAEFDSATNQITLWGKYRAKKDRFTVKGKDDDSSVTIDLKKWTMITKGPSSSSIEKPKKKKPGADPFGDADPESDPFGGSAKKPSKKKQPAADPFSDDEPTDDPFGGGTKKPSKKKQPSVDPFGDNDPTDDPFGGGTKKPSKKKQSAADPFGDDDPTDDPFGGGTKKPSKKKQPAADPFGDDDPTDDPFGGGTKKPSKKKQPAADPFGDDDTEPADDSFGSADSGEDPVLTLDAHMQRLAEEALGKIEHGTPVLIDPETGEILAIEERPKKKPVFDPPLKEVAAAKVPLADGFDFPVGKPDAEGYYLSIKFDPSKKRTSENWNGNGGGNTDLGDPVYAIGNGTVIFAEETNKAWGKVVILRHAYKDSAGKIHQINSEYNPLGKIDVKIGDEVKRGQQIGTIGNNKGMYLAHLRFEIRKNTEIGLRKSAFARDETNFHDPSKFIEANRPKR